MSHFDAPFDPAATHEQRTSGLAVASLVCSLICCIPITTIPGILLGVGALVSIGRDPARKGKGLAIAGILLGVIFTAGQAFFYPIVYDSFLLVATGPRDAITTGYAGDTAGFKAWFHGPGATASDAEAQAFIDALRDRYGNLTSIQPLGQSAQAKPGNPIVPFNYVFNFESGQVNAEVEIAFSDPGQGGFVMKLHSITIEDDELGELVYPPPAPETAAPETPESEVPEPAGDTPDPAEVDPDEPDSEGGG